MEADRIINKLKELYHYLITEDISVRALRKNEQWLIVFGKDGHEEAFALPGDFMDSCVEQGYCHLYREKCTRALGLLMESLKTPKTSATIVVEKMKQLIPELNNPEITMAVSEEKQAWTFFMTMKGSSLPVEFKLPMETITDCLEKGDCAELSKASELAYRCLLGE